MEPAPRRGGRGSHRHLDLPARIDPTPRSARRSVPPKLWPRAALRRHPEHAAARGALARVRDGRQQTVGLGFGVPTASGWRLRPWDFCEAPPVEISTGPVRRGEERGRPTRQHWRFCPTARSVLDPRLAEPACRLDVRGACARRPRRVPRAEPALLSPSSARRPGSSCRRRSRRRRPRRRSCRWRHRRPLAAPTFSSPPLTTTATGSSRSSSACSTSSTLQRSAGWSRRSTWASTRSWSRRRASLAPAVL